MQAVFQELQELTAGLNSFGPALEQAIALIVSLAETKTALTSEIASLKGEELAEDAQQAIDEAAVIESLKSMKAVFATMEQKVDAVSKTVSAEPSPEVAPAS